jgi:hypothetical protein
MMKSVSTKPFLIVVSTALALIVTTALSTSRAESPNDILIIANKSVNAKSISVDDLMAIFLRKMESFGGGRVVPINAKPGTTTRKAFQTRVLGMDGTSESGYWEKQKIKSGLTPPVEFAETVRAVFHMKGSIGYCRRSEYREGVVNVLLVL